MIFGRNEEEPSPQARVGGVVRTVSDAPVEAPPAARRKGAREGLILLLFAFLTIDAIALVLIREESRAVGDPAQKVLRGEVSGLSSHSLLREDNFRRALREVAERDRTLVTNLRVDPGRLSVTVRDDDGIQRLLNVDAGFGIRSDDAGEGLGKAVPLERIDTAAPARFVRAVAKRHGARPEDVDYLVLSISPIDGEAGWSLFLQRGAARVDRRHFLAAADGSDVRRPGEPSAAERAEARRREAEARRERRRQARRSRCFQRARTAAQTSRCFEL